MFLISDRVNERTELIPDKTELTKELTNEYVKAEIREIRKLQCCVSDDPTDKIPFMFPILFMLIILFCHFSHSVKESEILFCHFCQGKRL